MYDKKESSPPSALSVMDKRVKEKFIARPAIRFEPSERKRIEPSYITAQ